MKTGENSHFEFLGQKVKILASTPLISNTEWGQSPDELERLVCQGQYVGSWVIRGEAEAGRPQGAPMGGYQVPRGPPHPNQSGHNEGKVLPV